MFRPPLADHAASPQQAQHTHLNDHAPQPKGLPGMPPVRQTTEQRVMGTTAQDTWA